MAAIETLESKRLRLQDELDAAKTSAERNRLGQFATPPNFASEIVSQAASLLPADVDIRFFDPGFGTGSFFSALLQSPFRRRIELAAGYEIDPHYGDAAKRLWKGVGLRLKIASFTSAKPPLADAAKYNLVVCNPPYVRHHHLAKQQKLALRAAVAEHVGFDVGGLSGLYCYFMVLSQAWMAKDGVAAWLVPSEFMDVNYGRQVKRFLLRKVTLLRIHRFDPNEVQFGDALVSSSVVFFRNVEPPKNHRVQFTYGGTLTKPKIAAAIKADDLANAAKWTQFPQEKIPKAASSGGVLSDLFTIRRGVATGCNSFFLLTADEAARWDIPNDFLTPVLPSPRHLETDEIEADGKGYPSINRQLLLLNCDLDEEAMKADHPSLWEYLQTGVASEVNQRYLCRHRSPWYAQEKRPPAPFLCTYMGRPTTRTDRPFRFILNHSKAIAANVYLLLYPKPPLAAILAKDRELKRRVWRALSSITAEMLIGEGRVYGGGLHKIEPKELAKIPAEFVMDALPASLAPRQMTMF